MNWVTCNAVSLAKAHPIVAGGCGQAGRKANWFRYARLRGGACVRVSRQIRLWSTTQVSYGEGLDGMKPVMLVILLTLIPGTSRAAEAGQAYGVGLHTCGDFSQSYIANPVLAEGVYFAWAEGYMSGLNLVAAAGKNPAREFKGGEASMSEYQSFLRTYCDQHPSVRYLQGVTALWNSLPPIPPGK